jgi:phage tail sheath gpL-like
MLKILEVVCLLYFADVESYIWAAARCQLAATIERCGIVKCSISANAYSPTVS